MTRYFVAGNVWLVIALIVCLGRTYERSAPVRYSFFHSGQWLSPQAYTLLVLLPLAVGVFFLVLSWTTRSGR